MVKYHNMLFLNIKHTIDETRCKKLFFSVGSSKISFSNNGSFSAHKNYSFLLFRQENYCKGCPEGMEPFLIPENSAHAKRGQDKS